MRWFLKIFDLIVQYSENRDVVKRLNTNCKFERSIWVEKYKLHTWEMQHVLVIFNHTGMLLLRCKSGTSNLLHMHTDKTRSVRRVSICFAENMNSLMAQLVGTVCWGKGHVSTTCPYLTCLITLSISLSRRNFHQTFYIRSNCIITEWESTDCMSILCLITTFWYSVAKSLKITKEQSESKKNRQHNGQKKKHKRTNNDLQNIHIKLKIE